MKPTKFSLGQLVVTKGVHDTMMDNPNFRTFVRTCLGRYIECDWGDLCTEDAQQNDEAVETGGGRIHAAYCPGNKSWKIWIITEWDRSATTILFPSEY